VPTKNIWSLNIDELLVADRLKSLFNKSKYEVLFPLNSQMKDIDLVLLKLKNNSVATIQVKGSRTYDPKRAEVEKYGEGSVAWFRLTKESINIPTNKIDYYIFVLHCFNDNEHKKEIVINYLIVPSNQFISLCKKKTLRKGGIYHFFVWVDSNHNRAFDYNNKGNKIINLSKYLNNWELIKY
jgi:hypothetical protein